MWEARLCAASISDPGGAGPGDHTIGIVLLARGSTAFGIFILVGPALGAGVGLFVNKRAVARRQPGIPRERAKATGRILAPPPILRPSAPNRPVVWTGGGNVPTEMRRMNATWPLAVLAVHDARSRSGSDPSWSWALSGSARACGTSTMSSSSTRCEAG